MTRVIHSLWPWQGGCAATAEPDKVPGLTATPSGSTTINLAWDADTTAAPNQASEYEVWRSTNGSAPWTQIATVSAPTLSYSDTSLSAGTTRHYYIIARNCFDSANPSTSASATTAAGSIGPSWSLDFSTGTPSGYTLTRASTGTYVDSSGYVASASTDIARLTHNSSGSRLGLLVEGQRQNLVLRSEDFTTTWTNINTTDSANAATAPDNTSNADEIIESAGTTVSRLVQQTLSWTNGTTYTVSVFARAGTATCFQIAGRTNSFGTNEWATFDLSAGTVGSVGTSVTGSDATIEDFGNGWYRCKLTMVAVGTATEAIPFVLTNNTATTTRFPTYTVTAGNERGLYLWGAQVEAEATASSYIPTTTAAVTRSADLAHVLDSSITSWGSPGALVIHFYAPGQAGTLISTDNASTAQIGIEAQTSATTIRGMWSSGQTNPSNTSGTGVQKAVHYWNGTDSRFCLNGGTVQTGSNNLTIGNTDFVTLGAESTESGGTPNQNPYTDYANCIIRNVEFYSGTLTDANLQTITT